MRTYHMYQRIFSLCLSLIMVFSMIPAVAFASESGTVAGSEQVVDLNAKVATSRENNFNKGWKFFLGTNNSAQNKNFDDSAWESVDLPHDFSISQNYTTQGEAESGFLPGGTGWYRKSFTLDSAMQGKTYVLNFDGVYSDAHVYVNGTYVGEHHYGYTNFAFDITDNLVCDGATENVVAVKVVNNIPSSRWYSGSGIYRDVTLIVTNPVHVDVNGTYVTTPSISSGNGTVNVAVDVVNDGAEAAEVTVTNTVYKKGSESAVASDSATVTVEAGTTATATSAPVVGNPSLWSVSAPNLYVVKTEVSVGDAVVDTYETTFGFRWFSFDNAGFHLNGQNVKLNGMCLHHDQGALGSAAYYDAMYRQLSIMKDMGVNAIRTAHNPADEQFIEICNELGLLVIEEAFDGWIEGKNGNAYDFSRYFDDTLAAENGIYGGNSSMTWAEFTVKNFVKRDRNAPSIIAWSLGNEVQEGTDQNYLSQYPQVAENLINWISAVDATRPTTCGDNTRGNSGALNSVFAAINENHGVVGFNYAKTADTLSSLAQSYGGSNQVIIASETSSATNSRGQYRNQNNNTDSDGAFHLTSYDTSHVDWGITAHDSLYNTYQHDNVAGEFVWTGFDYLGEPTPWNGTYTGSATGYTYPNSSYFGIVETTGFEKDTYYLYRSQWNKNTTTLHLVTAWDSENMMVSDGKTPVWVYSNAPVVKLYRNDTLIGTAVRDAVTSSAGHTYYTYTTSSENTDICTTTSGSGADALYSVFNVAFEEGTLSAKAFEADGVTEIALTGNSGKNTVSTPDSVSKLVVSQNKSTVDADGNSLVYITVDVTDVNGNLDTTASNTIHFSLSGNGEIVGVDNGNQATADKYQQASVLSSGTSAHVDAYAGKALVIVKSTEDAGSINISVSSDGLEGGNAYVTTNAVNGDAEQEGLVSYTIVKDYTVKVGTVPTLNTSSTGTKADNSTVSGTIVWDEIPAEVYNTPGDYTIAGVLNFDGEEPIAVATRLHVVAQVVAMRNISTVTTPGNVPSLPTTVYGMQFDGTLAGEFNVTWDAVDASTLANVGDIVVVNGTATVMGSETLPVTCSIRVGEAVNTESNNVAPQSSELTQDIAEAYQSDVLSSINNGVTKPGDNTQERWSNWGNRTISADATLTFRWDTAQNLSYVDLYYYYDSTCADHPEKVTFQYSQNGSEFKEIAHTEEEVENYSLGAHYRYTFENVINPVALQITLTQKNGTTGTNCVALTEAEIYTFAGKIVYNETADLSAITVDGTAVEGFAADTLTYEVPGATVAATAAGNAAVTVLPAVNDVVRIVTLSEDGKTTKTYTVTLTEPAVSECEHTNTEIRNAKEATCTAEGYTGDTVCVYCNQTVVPGSVIEMTEHDLDIDGDKDATCTEEGYTGDIYCYDCGEVIDQGQVIPKLSHDLVMQNMKIANCGEDGYSGDAYCRMCQKIISTGSVTPATGNHTWNNGVVTQEPDVGVVGVKTYTCRVCYQTKTEEIPALESKKEAPSVSLSVKGESNKLVMTAMVNDYENLDKYYEITSHGILYIYTSRLGTRALTVNTANRTKVNFSAYKDDGSYIYRLTPRSKTQTYAVRAYLSYIDPDTNQTVYVYSNTVKGSYNTLK